MQVLLTQHLRVLAEPKLDTVSQASPAGRQVKILPLMCLETNDDEPQPHLGKLSSHLHQWSPGHLAKHQFRFH